MYFNISWSFLLNFALTCQRYYISLLPHRIPANQTEVTNETVDAQTSSLIYCS